MRCTAALALAFLALALPLCAQRGAAHGGFGGHAGFASHGSFAPSGRSGFAPRFGGQTPRYTVPGIRVPYGLRTAARGYPAGFSTARPLFYTRTGETYASSHLSGARYPDRNRGDHLRIVLSPYGYPGYANFGLLYPFWDDPFDPFWDDWDTDNGDNTQASAVYGDLAAPYSGPPPDEAAYSAPASLYAPQPEALAPAQAPEPEEEDAITIIFKDGRPPEQIRNYALTRTALYIPGHHIREIPLDEIDLPATERVNRQAGMDFEVPASR